MSTNKPDLTTQNHAIATCIGGDVLLTKAQLAAKLNLTPRGIECLTRARKLPAIRLGHRTLRYSWHRVCEALAKREVREV